MMNIQSINNSIYTNNPFESLPEEVTVKIFEHVYDDSDTPEENFAQLTQISLVDSKFMALAQDVIHRHPDILTYDEFADAFKNLNGNALREWLGHLVATKKKISFSLDLNEDREKTQVLFEILSQKSMTHLRRISMNLKKSVTIDQGMMNAFIQTLECMSKNNPHLKIDLNMEGCSLCFDTRRALIQDLPNIKIDRLNMSGQHMGNFTARIIGNILPHCKSLTHLKLNHLKPVTLLDYLGFNLIAKASAKSQLTYLGIQGNKVPDTEKENIKASNPKLTIDF